MRPPRVFYLLLFLGSSALLGFGYYLQFYKGIEPCPLCMFQRFAYMGVILISLVATLHGPRAWGLRVYSSLTLAAALIGGGIAAYQVRLIYLPPDQVPECGPGWNYMVDVFPVADVIKMAFTASGECAKVTWTFLGLSIPEWSLFCFTSIAMLSVVHLVRKKIFAFI